jgi:GTPase
LNDTSSSAGFCAIIGAPNAGKSTLVNQLVGSKVSIVSRKAQTTRARIRAIFIEGPVQVVLVDTPGIFTPKRKLDEAMVSNAWDGASQADSVVFLVDAKSGYNEFLKIALAGIEKARVKPMLAINKVDLISRDALLPLSATLNEAVPFTNTYMISALKGSGVEKLRLDIAAQMPPGPWLYPADQIADVHLRFIASEITREKIYERLHDELPYASTVETEAWEEHANGSVKISQTIYVERPSQKAIVLGKGGLTVKGLGQVARREMEQSFDRRVHLFLFVKVRENWAQDPERLRMMGLDL